jgi:hypothetical protein
VKALWILVFGAFCSSCCTTPTTKQERYAVTLSIYPDKSCTFVSTAPIRDPTAAVNLRPSEDFLRVACRYYYASFTSGHPLSNARPSTEVVFWYTNNPDVPMYVPNVEM